LRRFLEVSRLGVRRMSAGSALQARRPATESARSPILVRIRGMSKVRLFPSQYLERSRRLEVCCQKLMSNA